MDHTRRVGVDRTAARAFLFSLGRYHVEEASTSLYGEATWTPLAGVRAVGGLRGEYYHYAVRAQNSAAAAAGTGCGDDAIVSPKASVVYAPTEHVELYANWGRGFHSNDVRGAVNVDTRCRCWCARRSRGRRTLAGIGADADSDLMVARRRQRAALRRRLQCSRADRGEQAARLRVGRLLAAAAVAGA
ncbi:TonB-dependent receptor [Sphingomonas sp. GC_Shp_3]|uniref:TonB-dependent receptor n=1 Tax=Sphingomonas sp. GC_Shp_3 TaxID=2937383 RepID=UPI003211CAB4